jgi:peptide/nickel transport system permease protein
MLRYVTKRILLFLPTLLVISFFAFGLSRCTPGDPIHCYLPNSIDGKFAISPDQYERAYLRKAKELGWDKPTFYFTITSAAYPDTLHHVLLKEQRQCLTKLLAQSGNWPLTETYYQQIGKVHRAVLDVPDSLNSNALIRIRSIPGQLYQQYEPIVIRNMLDTLQYYAALEPSLAYQVLPAANELDQRFQNWAHHPKKQLLYLPALYWHGTNNQYHHWLINFVTGDLGKSCKDGRPIFGKIMDHLRWTLLINGLAILIAYVLSVPIGVYAAFHKGGRLDRFSTFTLFLLYSLPNFWVATLLVIFFTNPTYGMDWFPATGLGNLSPSVPFWKQFWDVALHLVLPVFSLAYGTMAFISRQMRASVLEVINTDYIRTARAKGVPEKDVIWKHSFRNALFPLITLFANVFPALLAGSIVIERVFNIPGMGLLLIDSINSKDWQVVYAILMMAAVVTILGILLADLLYAWNDPRVRFDHKKT